MKSILSACNNFVYIVHDDSHKGSSPGVEDAKNPKK